MPSGYENEPDYGAPPPLKWYHYVLMLFIFLIIGTVYTACTRPDLVKLTLDAN